MDVEIAEAVRSAVGRASEESKQFGSERLNELGWNELLSSDAESATRAYFEEQGRLLLSSSALDSVVLAAIDGPWSWPTTRVVYPRPTAKVEGAASDKIDGILFTDVAFETALVPLGGPEGTKLYVVQASDATIEPVDGMDASLGLARFTADRSSAVLAEGDLADRWDAGLLAGRRALAHELIGLSNRMMSIAVEHVTVREQFGRPLGANQAIQHRLADAQVDIAAAEMLADESWTTATPLAGAAAKGLADKAFGMMQMHGQQVLGGIGYTWEHDWRHHARRGMILSALLGSTDECEREVAQHLLADGIVRIGNIV